MGMVVCSVCRRLCTIDKNKSKQAGGVYMRFCLEDEKRLRNHSEDMRLLLKIQGNYKLQLFSSTESTQLQFETHQQRNKHVSQI